MAYTINNLSTDTRFLDKIREISGQNVFKCFQCGTCTGSCPMIAHITASPRKLMAFLQLGQKETLEAFNTPWVCASCHTCMVRCPRGLDIPRVMEALRQITLRQSINRIEPSNLQPEEVIDLPQIAMVSGFRKLTG